MVSSLRQPFEATLLEISENHQCTLESGLGDSGVFSIGGVLAADRLSNVSFWLLETKKRRRRCARIFGSELSIVVRLLA